MVEREDGRASLVQELIDRHGLTDEVRVVTDRDELNSLLPGEYVIQGSAATELIQEQLDHVKADRAKARAALAMGMGLASAYPAMPGPDPLRKFFPRPKTEKEPDPIRQSAAEAKRARKAAKRLKRGV